MGNNPVAQMFQMLNGGNPQDVIKQMVGSNPNMKRAVEMSDGKTPDQIKQVCKNICEQKGIDFDQAFNQFQSQYKGK